MKQFDVVKLVNEKPYLKNNLNINDTGVILKIEEPYCIVRFVNESNRFDYAVVKVNKADVLLDDYKLPQRIIVDYIENLDKLLKCKDTLNKVSIRDFDEVEVIVEKEEYAKAGVRKGEIGYVMDFKAVENHLLVDLPYLPEKYWDDAISVDYLDLKILKRDGKEYKGE